MSLQSTTRGYKGRGRFILKPIGGGRPFELGNVTGFTESIEVDRQSRQNYTTAAGGELDVDENVTSFTFEATCNDITPRNIAAGFLANIEQIGAQSISDEIVESWSGTRIGFRYLPDPDQAVSITVADDTTWTATTAVAAGAVLVDTTEAYLATTGGETGATEPTWPTANGTVTDGTVVWQHIGKAALVAGDDYDRTPHGIRVKDTPVNIAYPDDETMVPLKATYERNPQYLIQALAASQQVFELRWEGLNSVDSGNPLHATYFRVKLSPTSGFQRHGGDDFAELTLSGTVLSDDARTGEGLSKFVEMAMI
jgi:hypothetical protein